jgi:UDP-GlcNAc:undecaprenyl-phosphate GlcNAc-1-phosphate transferase
MMFFIPAAAFGISLGTVALILKISHRMRWYDRVSERKVHNGNIPRLGGLGFAFSFVACFFYISFRYRDIGAWFQFLLILAAMIFILVCGVWDDFKPMRPRTKLILQAGAAACVLASGYVFERAFFIEEIDFLSFPRWKLFRYPLTFVWIAGVTNAVNLIDGVDGLAGGISLLAAVTLGAVFLALGAGGAVPLSCFCLASSVLGFLVYNLPFPRARIFMGDGGAYFLGFMLSLFPLMGDGGAGLPLAYAGAVLLIPILDTVSAVWRRLRDRKRVDSPDRSHTHHKLMGLGLSSRSIDAVLFGLQLVLGVLVYIAVKSPGYSSLGILLMAYAVGVGFFVVVHFLNRKKLTYAEA